jgi:hypothetical protein
MSVTLTRSDLFLEQSGFVTFGSKMARSFGQMTNSNKGGLDNPFAYAEVMTKLFGRMHIFGEHTCI